MCSDGFIFIVAPKFMCEIIYINNMNVIQTVERRWRGEERPTGE